ncbi:NUDIX domain-containing protein [Streptomyces sp. NPDC006458]|uniref:NUDIX hydrolase n=1 Tax=Streptomyces sp. NPDC006458 TaxID=3154302 RepID=UPI0033BA0D28
MGEWVERVDEDDVVLGVVDREEAVRCRWLHRIATVVCRDGEGRILVHRRPHGADRFAGQLNWMLGGAAGVGESYGQAAARELAEELGARVRPRFRFKFLCEGVISPYWLAVHEAVVTGPVRPDPSEIAWYGWLAESELADLAGRQDFVADAREAFDRYRALPVPPGALPGAG